LPVGLQSIGIYAALTEQTQQRLPMRGRGNDDGGIAVIESFAEEVPDDTAERFGFLVEPDGMKVAIASPVGVGHR
jgi:hypothetical protein